jgi:hypothetical protein
MDHVTTFSSMASAVVVGAALAIGTSSGALGACKTTLRGELVKSPGSSNKVLPQKFLFFTLVEKTPASPTGSDKHFQSFVVPNASTALPIPFALDIDSPKDCPSELELRVDTDDTDHPPMFSYGAKLLRGRKTIRLDKFESIPVMGPSF